jgi:hypothetical protein
MSPKPILGYEHKKDKGVYTNYVLQFNKGGGLPKNKYQEPSEAVGFPKKDLSDALTLGTGGNAIVGYVNIKDNKHSVRCFKNKKGWDIAIHEPNDKDNKAEDVNIYITSDWDVNPKTKWHFLGRYDVEGIKDNLIHVDLGKIKLGRWIKVEGAKELLEPTGHWAGFELSATFIKYPCMLNSN